MKKTTKILAGITIGLISSAFSTQKAHANCVALYGPIGFFMSQPCPVMDLGLKSVFGEQNVAAGKSLYQSGQQLQQTVSQLRNSVSIFQSIFSDSQNLKNSFSTFGEWNGLDYHSGYNAPDLLQNFRGIYASWQMSALSTITSQLQSAPYILASRSASQAYAYAMQNQSWDMKKNPNDLAQLATAVSASTTMEDDWNANTAIKIKIAQQLQIRNSLIAQLAKMQASHDALSMQSVIRKAATIAPQSTGTFHAVTPDAH